MKKIYRLIICVAVASLYGVLQLQAASDNPVQDGEWPQWRGPNRDGISKETAILKAWPKAGPEVRWRIPMGEGFSAISISRGRAYTMFAQNRQEYVVCLDASTGQEIWRFKSGSEFGDWQGGDGPRSTPTVDGNLVYTVSAHGMIHALHAKSGNVVWKHDFRKSFRSDIPQWGFSTSPLVEGNMLLVEAGGPSGNSLIAFDKLSGRIIWSSQSDGPAYSSPIAVTINGTRQIVFMTAKGAVGVSPDDGKVFWRYNWRTSYDANIATPIFIAPDKIFISSGYDTGAAVIQIEQNGPSWKANQVWKNRVMKNHFATSVLYDGYLYGFDNSILKCIDARTGKEVWKKRGFRKGSLMIADGHMIILSGHGQLAIARVTPERYDEVSIAPVLSGRCWTVPSLAGGMLYLRNAKEAVCLDIRSK